MSRPGYEYDDDWWIIVRWDPETCTWTCPCLIYQKYGKCSHLRFYRRTVEVPVLEKYL
jgi:hypothetical protein